jgi:hypothetical protein
MDLRKYSVFLSKELSSLLLDIEKGMGTEVLELPPKSLMPVGTRFIIEEDGIKKEYIKLKDGEYHLLGGGGNSSSAREIELQKSATSIQWKYTDSETWTDLIAISEITGSDGTDGSPGADGKEIELQKSVTHIQWRYVGDAEWTDLVALSEITGTNGTNGSEIQLRVDSGYIQWKYEDDVSWTNLVLLEDLKGDTGAAGQSIHHSEFTSTTAVSGLPNEPGETDTYTVWGDVGETINLGTFTVYNGDDGVGGGGALDDLTDVDAASPTDGQVLTYNTATSKWIPTTIAVAAVLLMSLSVDSWWGLGVFNFGASTIVLAE